ncbi:MAG: aspartate aminotransferase family protein [Candidatus Hydrogenedentes bacterium]|nr:aspartate aminotransferase family protein [Candidatus Hydrogenedentota bacterium]
MQIPAKGLPKSEILQMLESFKQNDLAWRSGRVLAYTYDPGAEVDDVAKAAYLMYLTENALDPTSFPSVVKLESDVVRMVIDLLRGDKNVVGSFTSGGTESILLAVKAARDWARVHKPHIKQPEFVVPRTAHAAFHKAAAYFGLTINVAPVNASSYLADVDAMRARITDNTILLVGSAPGYAHGAIDPIEDIAALAQEKGLLCHVDGCVGGIHLSLMRRMGYALPAFDFTVPGVTSISADMHKYGYSPKGASIVMYRNKELRRHQLFACAASTTYALINPTILSTKSGGPMAGAWAVLHYLGEEGYARVVRGVMDTTARMIDGISQIDGLRVLGKPDMCMFSIASGEFNIFQLADEMKLRGWYLQPQFSIEGLPANLHITVTQNSATVVDEFLAALRDAVAAVKKDPNPIDANEIRTNIDALLAQPGEAPLKELAAMLGIDGTRLPERMALLNTVLDAIPDDLAEEVLTDFLNDLYA